MENKSELVVKEQEHQKQPEPIEIIHKKWQLLSSQKTILEAIVNRHESELRPLKRYHEDELKRVLEELQKEAGIPSGYNQGLGFNRKTLEFCYNGPNIYPPEPEPEATKPAQEEECVEASQEKEPTSSQET